MRADAAAAYIPETAIDVLELGRRARKGRKPLRLGREIKFSTAGLESYAFAAWEPLIYDAMVLAAAIEYGDRIVKRPPRGWAREISVRIPVHDPARWTAPPVARALQDAIEFLTGDYWILEFVGRIRSEPGPSQKTLSLPVETKAVLAYSDGLDSRAVAGIQRELLGDRLVCVRVGSKGRDQLKINGSPEPFARVPYQVHCNLRSLEPSARTRGFKFALISSIAAYLANAEEIILPESGQGALGPALINVGHAYPDYRNHPFFTLRMERFVEALFGRRLRFVFPRLWHTKGETLSEFVSLPGPREWESTWSCWRDNRWSSVNEKLRQCGVCAACMLRRLSVHVAGLKEASDVYVCTNINASTLDEGLDSSFTRNTPVLRNYAIAGVLHLQHLAEMAGPEPAPLVVRHATLLARALGLPREEAESSLGSLLRKHATEWEGYLDSLEEQSFVKQWAQSG